MNETPTTPNVPNDSLSVDPAPQPPTGPAQPTWGSPEPGAPSAGPVYGPPPAAGPSYGAPRVPVTVPPQPAAPGASFFDTLRNLGIVRATDDRKLAGVCAGIARKLNISPTAVRIGFVVFALLFGAGLLFYGLLWMFLPQPDGRIHGQEVLKGNVTAGFVGALIAILFGGPVNGATMGDRPGWLSVIAVAVLVGVLIGRRSKTSA